MRNRIFGLLVATALAVPMFAASPASAEPTGHCHWWEPPTTIVGTFQADRLVGTDCDNVIYGLRGNDRIIGRAGEDTLNGNQDRDVIRGVDGEADQLRGGLGRDRCVGDQFDSFFSCETRIVVPVL